MNIPFSFEGKRLFFEGGGEAHQQVDQTEQEKVLDEVSDRTGDKDLLEPTDIQDFLQDHEERLQGNEAAQEDLKKLRGQLDVVERADKDLQDLAQLLLRVEQHKTQESQEINKLGLTEKQSQDFFNHFESKIDGYKSGEWHEWNVQFLNIIGEEGLSEPEGMDVVRKIQEELGVKIDGKIGPITADAILGEINPEYRAKREKQAQERINRIQYFSNPDTYKGGGNFSDALSPFLNTDATDYIEAREEEPTKKELMKKIANAAEEFGMTKYLPIIFAQVEQESSWDPKAHNSVGENSYGLFQVYLDVHQGTADRKGFGDLKEVDNNIRYGVHFLSEKLAQYGNIVDALDAYNGGANFKRPIDRRYSTHVLKRLDKYTVKRIQKDEKEN